MQVRILWATNRPILLQGRRPLLNRLFCTYHKPLHLKCTLLTAKFSSFFIVLRDVSGGLTCSYNLLGAISTASLSWTLVYKLVTSREIILSSESNSVFSKISLAIWVFVSMFAPSKYFANVLYRLSYELPGEEGTGRSRVPCLCTFANPYSLAGCVPVDLNLLYIASLISSFFFMASNSLFISFSIFIITLSVRFFLSLNCSACIKSLSFSHKCPFSFHKNPTPYQTVLPEDRCPSNISGFFNTFVRGGLFHILSISLCSCFNLT